MLEKNCLYCEWNSFKWKNRILKTKMKLFLNLEKIYPGEIKDGSGMDTGVKTSVVVVAALGTLNCRVQWHRNCIISQEWMLHLFKGPFKLGSAVSTLFPPQSDWLMQLGDPRNLQEDRYPLCAQKLSQELKKLCSHSHGSKCGLQSY